MKKLTSHDISLIKHLKSAKPTFQGIKEIYAKRNAVTVDIVVDAYIVDWMLQLVMDHCKPLDRDVFNMIIDTLPANQWKFTMADEPQGHFENWIRILASRLRLTEVKYFPNYPCTSISF